MKKVALALLVTLTLCFVMSSCNMFKKKTSFCPAYGETSKYQIETRY